MKFHEIKLYFKSTEVLETVWMYYGFKDELHLWIKKLNIAINISFKFTPTHNSNSDDCFKEKFI